MLFIGTLVRWNGGKGGIGENGGNAKIKKLPRYKGETAERKFSRKTV